MTFSQCIKWQELVRLSVLLQALDSFLDKTAGPSQGGLPAAQTRNDGLCSQAALPRGSDNASASALRPTGRWGMLQLPTDARLSCCMINLLHRGGERLQLCS